MMTRKPIPDIMRMMEVLFPKYFKNKIICINMRERERERMTDGRGSQWSIFNPGVRIT